MRSFANFFRVTSLLRDTRIAESRTAHDLGAEEALPWPDFTYGEGCARGKFVHVALPHARSALVALGIITFIGAWNDFLGPLVFLDSTRKYTLPVGLALFQSSYANDYGLLFAASVVSSLPLLVVFVVFQTQIVRGISFTGMKE